MEATYENNVEKEKALEAARSVRNRKIKGALKVVGGETIRCLSVVTLGWGILNLNPAQIGLGMYGIMAGNDVSAVGKREFKTGQPHTLGVVPKTK